MSETATYDVPRAGMLATVRNRSGVVAAVEPGENTMPERLDDYSYIDEEGTADGP